MRSGPRILQCFPPVLRGVAEVKNHWLCLTFDSLPPYFHPFCTPRPKRTSHKNPAGPTPVVRSSPLSSGALRVDQPPHFPARGLPC